MKISRNWLAEYVDLNISDDDLVSKIGAQLGAVEETINYADKYKDALIVKVVSCEKHGDADKLKVCLIDDGGAKKSINRDSKGLIQVVCGAPNANDGMMAVWLPPGAVLPAASGKEPIILAEKEIRGVISHGMLASSKELGLSDDHEGILELGAVDSAPGTEFAKAYKLDDLVIDIENKMFTNRSDCFGLLGVAREVAGINNQSFISPEWYLEEPNFPQIEEKLPLVVKNNALDLVPRFMAVVLEISGNRPSPMWLKSYLTRAGIRPINLIVDITNYVMVLSGQPLHAYDYDKLAKLSDGKPSLIARLAKENESIELIGGKTTTLEQGSILISTDKNAIGIAGVMGGKSTEVDENTTKIALECANFDMYSIRKTAMQNGIFTDAVTRFTKKLSPHACDRVLAFTVDMMMRLADARVAGPVYDLHQNLSLNNEIKVSTDFINSRLGSDLNSDFIATLLKNVEFKVEVTNDELTVHAPFWRTDIAIKEDIVEEVGRLNGYDKLPIVLPTRSLDAPKRNELLDLKSNIRSILSASGANELLTYSFVNAELMNICGQDVNRAYQLSNALSPDLQYYRLGITPSLLEKVRPNIKAGFNEFAVFEIGKIYTKDDKKIDDSDLPTGKTRVGLVFAADDKTSQAKYSGAPYYQASKYLEYLMNRLNIDYDIKPTAEVSTSSHYSIATAAGRSAEVLVDDKVIGIITEPNLSIKQTLKLPKFVACFEIDIDELVLKQKTSHYKQLSKYPKIVQDITLQKPDGLSIGELKKNYRNELQNQFTSIGGDAKVRVYDLFVTADKQTNVTFRVEATSYQKTLINKQLNELLEKAASNLNLKRI